MGGKVHWNRNGRFRLFGAVSFWATLALNGVTQPFIPASDDVVLERLPVSSGPGNRELAALRAAYGGDPDNLERAVKLAGLYIKLGQAESDPRYYGYAQGVLSPWWTVQDPPTRVLLLPPSLSRIGMISRVRCATWSKSCKASRATIKLGWLAR